MSKNKYEANDIIELSNQLSIDDMVTLINCFSSNISAYIGSAGNHVIDSELDWTCTNGHSIQLNLQSVSEYEDLKDWKFLMDGLKKRSKK
jgi:hypothetical protein